MSKLITEILNDLNPEFLGLENFIKEEIQKLNEKYQKSDRPFFSEKDTFLITYADQVQNTNKTPLVCLKKFIEEDLENTSSIIHLLPFYPWTSDDGFSPIDYQKVESEYGTWEDIESFHQDLMFDCVFNHMSSKSIFFQEALKGDIEKQKMFHFVSEDEYNSKEFQENILKVVRPRTSPLFTPYDVCGETKYVWTTFSADQVDTNLNNIDMLKYLLETFFLYINKGARYFRVDAVPFMWKEFGTNCSHLPKTHRFVQLLRAIVDKINLNLYLVTESNVPHKENISYWGDGTNEAHIIYNFSLAPLILHGIQFETAKYINFWAANVFDIHEKTTYLNFTASHDGIGMRGLEGIVPEADVAKLCELTEIKGGKVGKKKSRDGTIKPYELNITWASFMSDEDLDIETFIRKVVNSHAIVMFFPGIGAHYIHNFLGSLNWQEGFEESGIPRRLNRKKLDRTFKFDDVSEQIKLELIKLIKLKSSNAVFSPNAEIQVLDLHPKCLAFKRIFNGEEKRVLFNLSKENIEFDGIKISPYELNIS